MANNPQNYIDELNQNWNNQIDAYKKAAEQNTGIQGYSNALNLGGVNARSTASNTTNQAINEAIAAGQQAGMSKAAAAMNAGNAAANTYAQTFGSALSSNIDTINNYQSQAMGAAQNIYEAQLENAKTQFQTKLAEYQRKQEQRKQMEQMIWNLIGSYGGTAFNAAKTGVGALADIAKSKQMQNNANATRSYAYGKKAQYPSDENLKDKDKIEDFLDNLNTYVYTYNEEGKAKGADDDVHIGTTAQDLQKSEIGDAMVSVDENGDLQVNRQKMVEATAAAIKLIQEELKNANS